MKLTKATIVELATGLRKKNFSAVDVVTAHLEEIGSKDGDINAFVFVDEDGAYESARHFDKRLAEGEELPVLAGIPVGVKDIFCTKGVKTTACSNILKNFVPPYDATVVKKLRHEGMVMMGKLNLDEFACGASTEHSAFGVTKNPYNLDYVAGGSSGGSAAAVAANMCTYSLGTDTGGSIRQPASFCGIYGLKPTYGRVSRSGVSAMASSWDTIGPMAKCTEDIAIIMQTIAGRDRMDSTTVDKIVPNYLQTIKGDVKGLKIGIPKEYFTEGIDGELKEAIFSQIKWLEKNGAEVIDISLPTTEYAVAVYYVTMPAELSTNLERFDGIRYGSKFEPTPDNLFDHYAKTRGEGFGTEIKRRIMMGTYVLSAGYYDAYYKKAQKVRTLIIEDFNSAFEKVDVLIAPVAPTPAFKIGGMINDPLAMYMADALTIPASAAGLPAISVPVGFSKDGLPLGMQIIGPQFEEGRIMKVSAFLENNKS